jgi:hypothetical protein
LNYIFILFREFTNTDNNTLAVDSGDGDNSFSNIKDSNFFVKKGEENNLNVDDIPITRSIDILIGFLFIYFILFFCILICCLFSVIFFFLYNFSKDFELNGNELNDVGIIKDTDEEMRRYSGRDKKRVEGVDSFYTQEDEDEDNEENNYYSMESNYLNKKMDINTNHENEDGEEISNLNDSWKEEERENNDYFNNNNSDWVWGLSRGNELDNKSSFNFPKKYKIFRRLAMAIGCLFVFILLNCICKEKYEDLWDDFSSLLFLIKEKIEEKQPKQMEVEDEPSSTLLMSKMINSDTDDVINKSIIDEEEKGDEYNDGGSVKNLRLDISSKIGNKDKILKENASKYFKNLQELNKFKLIIIIIIIYFYFFFFFILLECIVYYL